jgi:SAM-dependent methyltransferase
MNYIKRIIKYSLLRIVHSIPQSSFESLIYKLVEWRVNVLPAAGALRFLFNLENNIYPLQGRKAIEYDGGIHTKHRHLRYHDFFVNRIKPNESVLDIGCGIGALAYNVAEKAGAFVTGIDISSRNIDQAKANYAHPKVIYMVGDALKQLPKKSFDIVILSNVLEHLPERSMFLNQVRKTVSAKKFLIRVPVFERDWRIPLKRELGVEFKLDPTHKTEYTLESFAQEMIAAGMRITHQEVRWGEIWGEVVPDA